MTQPSHILPPHILIVDDHREIRDALVKYLEKNGLRATSAANAVAMDAAMRSRPSSWCKFLDGLRA